MMTNMTLSLCRIQHSVGDANSVVFPYPSRALEMAAAQELMSLPGIFAVTYDHCAYGQFQCNRQMLITNQPWLADLSRDCQCEHAHTSKGERGEAV